MTKPKVISFVGGPGIGKSTSAARLFAYLREACINAELVTEYAKELHYRGVLDSTDQVSISQEQIKRLSVCRSPEVDITITDSDPILGLAYCTTPEQVEAITPLIQDCLNRRNTLFVVNSPRATYDARGRHHTREESSEIHQAVLDLLSRHELTTMHIASPWRAVETEHAAVASTAFDLFGLPDSFR